MKFSIPRFAGINGGLLLVAVGIHVFKVPNHFVNGGVSGLAILASHFFDPGAVGPVMTVLNTLLVVAGFVFLGRNFGWSTIYASFALSFMVWGLDLLVPIRAPLTNDPLLELLFAIALPAVGSGLVFNLGASTGGTDIVAKILNARTSLNTGTALLVSDFVIAFAALAVFDVKTGLYSVLGLVLKAFLVDLVIEGLNVNKKLEIISSQGEAVVDYILHTLHRGATLYEGTGAYTGTPWRVIHCVVNRREAWQLRQRVRELDPKAFITITTTSDMIGKGFRGA